MTSITFVDTEIDPKNKRILDIGAIIGNGAEFHSNSVTDFIEFIRASKYICGHNIYNHDIKYIENAVIDAGISYEYVIDTLFLSPLLFPAKPYHSLLKDDKLQTDEINNPLNDAMKARDLFFDEVAAFKQLDDDLKQIFFNLLHNEREFKAFFTFVDYKSCNTNLENLIRTKFHTLICENVNIEKLIHENPVELSYCLALINTRKKDSITPPWVVRNYRGFDRIMRLLRNKPCLTGCVYCNEALDIHKGLKRFLVLTHLECMQVNHYRKEPLRQLLTINHCWQYSLLAVVNQLLFSYRH